MEDLMATTNQFMQAHINSYETLKNSIMLINQEAKDAIESLEEFDEKPANKSQALQRIDEQEEDEDDAISKFSHE
jgi:uncharacterized protein (UPF0335 family)